MPSRSDVLVSVNDLPDAVNAGAQLLDARWRLALASLGIEAALHPPSWSGWSADPSRPVATGEQP